MKFRYAINEIGETIDVLDLKARVKEVPGPFICASCSSELIPVLGDIRTKHFRHKTEGVVNCCHESYLHILAKRKFVEGLGRCQAQHRPYLLQLKENHRCTKWQTELNYVCELGPKKLVHDLATRFDRVELEGSVSGFKADVLLSNSKTSEVLLIEFCVTHLCSDKKISSNLRIAEVKIASEECIDGLLNGLEAFHDATTLYNFPETTIELTKCPKRCNFEAELFVVQRSGRARILKGTPETLVKDCENLSVVHRSSTHNIYQGDRMTFGGLDFENEVSNAAKHGINVRACSICKHSSVLPARLKYICKKSNRRVGHGAAVECSQFVSLV